MHVIAATGDLNVGSKFEAVCSSAGATWSIALTIERLLQALGDQLADVVLIDLESFLAEESLIAAIRSRISGPGRIVAFGPHVQTARLQNARDAGCDQVWTKGQWPEALGRMLRDLSAA
jgi:hypothetical protein